MPNFASVFKSLRKKLALSQQEMANQLGLSKSAVNMYERGERQPNFETLEKIADFFNLDIDFLLGRSSKQNIDNCFNHIIPQIRRDEKEIEKILAQTKAQLTSQEGLMFNGFPASTEEIESILSAMQIGMEIAKRKNKERLNMSKCKEIEFP